MLSKLGRIDSRVLYLILLIAFIVPLLCPLGLPMIISDEIKRTYDLIESLPEGSRVVVSFDLSPGGYDELAPASAAVFNHMAMKGLRLIGMSFWDAGPSLLDRSLAGSLYVDKEYGDDYVNLGFLAGGENAMAAAARDIRGAFPSDFHDNPTANMPIFEGVQSLKDVEMVIVVATGNPGVPEWIRQVGDPMGVPIATIVIAGLVADYAPYIQSKQLIGMIPGLRGAAGYESLIDMLGRGTAGLDAQSVAHLMILIFVLVGNIVYFAERSREKEESAKEGAA
ncbi:MAG: hypothetical protein ACOX35_02130 [Bacillota bacterium]|jgi:hypothetical protein